MALSLKVINDGENYECEVKKLEKRIETNRI